jgi:energy-coupling factor transporter ATP-binding protein EcfA2
MRISTVYARFYKSLNFDYVLKSNGAAGTAEWDRVLDGRWFPHVQVALQPDITTIVGSNESGKTQVVDAIRFALTGERIARRDFCRYSEFFAVDAPVSYPEFGMALAGDDQSLVETANELLELEKPERLNRLDGIRLFRRAFDGHESSGVVYWPGEDGSTRSKELDTLERWTEILPDVWEIDANVALPDSVPIDWLLEPKAENALSRQERVELFNSVLTVQHLFTSTDTVTQNAAAIAQTLNPLKRVKSDLRTQLSVAADLIFRVAGVDRSNIQELRRAIEDGEEGYVATIIASINEQIERELAPNRWWSQDSEFRLLVSPRDHDLVLTIRDRTGKDYTFDERSRGLKYFLSYLVQFLAGRPRVESRPKMLLMDEPDAYLSSQGQQDLLRILATAANPEDPAFAPCQVVYVTHSPFLIDRNHPERVRVLEKGDLDEGTRVVSAAHHNRFEPIRTALGQQVGETTFVGADNVIVEGVSDQILIAGLNTHLRRAGLDGKPIPRVDLLDLNEVIIVQAGGTPHIPYMTFLARGRGEVKPSVVVLLDSDNAGDKAAAELSTLSKSNSSIIRDDLVLRIADLPGVESEVETIEDLVPWGAARVAVQQFLEQIGREPVALPETRPSSNGQSAYDQINATLTSSGGSIRCGKVAFAKSVVETVGTLAESHRVELEANFAPLIKLLAQTSVSAGTYERSGQIRRRLARSIRSFKKERSQGSQRQWAASLLDEIESLVDQGPNYEPLRHKLRDLRHEFALSEDLGEPFDEHNDFVSRLDPLLNLLRIEDL